LPEGEVQKLSFLRPIFRAEASALEGKFPEVLEGMPSKGSED